MTYLTYADKIKSNLTEFLWHEMAARLPMNKMMQFITEHNAQVMKSSMRRIIYQKLGTTISLGDFKTALIWIRIILIPLNTKNHPQKMKGLLFRATLMYSGFLSPRKGKTYIVFNKLLYSLLQFLWLFTAYIWFYVVWASCCFPLHYFLLIGV